MCVLSFIFLAQAMKYYMTSNDSLCAFRMGSETSYRRQFSHISSHRGVMQSEKSIHTRNWLNIFIVNITQRSVICMHTCYEITDQ